MVARCGRSVPFFNGVFLCLNACSAVLAWWLVDQDLNITRQCLAIEVFLQIGSLFCWNLRHWILRQLRERPY